MLIGRVDRVPHGHQHHGHGAGHESQWDEMRARLEREGEATMPIIIEALDAIALAVGDAEVHRALDLGSGPGVASVAMAQRFASAVVTAVDSSSPLLDGAPARAARFGVGDRVDTRTADLEQSIADIAAPESVDVVWASMVLHHVARLPGVLADLQRCLRPGGVVAILEFGSTQGAFPEGANVGREEFAQRVSSAMTASLEAHLPAGAMALDWDALLTTAGFEPLADRELVVHRAPPLSDVDRQYVLQTLQMMARHGQERLGPDDLAELDGLVDVSSPRCVLHREDLPLHISRRFLLARRG